ncbi:MAG TPA: outer membrane beta-barrel protein, partial [Bacteroidia bacterium]|nr:outer membrane beta-barrel protein [Bacteroidia bacterium]
QNYSDYNYKNYGTIVLKYEHGLAKYFGFGLNLEYSGANVTYKYPVSRGPFRLDTNYQANVNGTVMGFYARLNGHYPIGDKFDIFAGFGLGYLLTIDKSTDNNPNSNNKDFNTQSIVFDYQFTFGLRYMVKEHFGLFAELGYASTTVQMGVTLGF